MIHSFDTDEAIEYGVNAAIILSNLRFWIDKNNANRKHFYDGKYWTYNSYAAFNELFPYFGEKQIRNALATLKESGVIEIGNYNINTHDRTQWYSISAPKTLNTSAETTDGCVVSADGLSPKGKSVNTDIKPDEKLIIKKNKSSNQKTLTQFIDQCREEKQSILRDYAGLWKYADAVSLPEDFIAIAWFVFKTKYTESGTHAGKLQKDWRATFLNYIKNNYLKLWWIDAGEFKLNTTGMMAEKEYKASIL
jgi:hypothetical protein